MHYWAAKSVQYGADAFMYYFTHQPLGTELGAFHAAEIVFAFNNVAHMPTFAGARNLKLAEDMSDQWVRFASYGNPNGVSPVSWPNYSLDVKGYMEFGSKGSRANSGLMQGKYEVFEDIYQRER